MIPLDAFFPKPDEAAMVDARDRLAAHAEGGTLTPEMDQLRKRARNALAKAKREKPKVRRLVWLDKLRSPRRYYSVRTRKRTEYRVTLTLVRGERWFGGCTCPAGEPPADEYTGVSKWHHNPCYHLAAVLLEFVKTVNLQEAKRTRQIQRAKSGGRRV